jgi:hypothetical protein
MKLTEVPKFAFSSRVPPQVGSVLKKDLGLQFGYSMYSEAK